MWLPGWLAYFAGGAARGGCALGGYCAHCTDPGDGADQSPPSYLPVRHVAGTDVVPLLALAEQPGS